MGAACRFARLSSSLGCQTRRRRVKATGQGGSNRVNRGGSWNNNAGNERAAYRNNNTPTNRNNNIGFRLVSPGGLAALPRRARSGAITVASAAPRP
ncbi:MAG: SUMF1/EgtB/PvdO family nonheme iron enzyme [Cyanobacteria bacterium REEB65]|nr:SUMF1/EgtB/PvdO family nonheme iron enzyme [Cyanobacteria bacterium REEB65]